MKKGEEVIQDKINASIEYEDGHILKLRSTGIILTMKRVCDNMLSSGVGRPSYIPELELALKELKKTEAGLIDYRNKTKS